MEIPWTVSVNVESVFMNRFQQLLTKGDRMSRATVETGM